jgi:hypothetical protein
MSFTVEGLAAILFALALAHTFAASAIAKRATRWPRHADALHLLGEVEVVFGFWASLLLIGMAFLQSAAEAVRYAESRHYTEPAFVFVVMVVAASRPILACARGGVLWLARALPLPAVAAQTWLGLAAVPLLGSLITEPAAMTLAALMLAPLAFRTDVPERIKYLLIGALFVNVSIGGVLTSYAAPPVLMVAKAWEWDSAFMFDQFGWKAVTAVMINATVATWLARRHLRPASPADADAEPVPLIVQLVHIAFLTLIVVFAHHPVIFLGLFMFFLGFVQAYARHQSPLLLREGLLVGFFLAGLVLLGGMQQWWLAPLVSGLSPLALYFGAIGLTAITDNAALTYLGTLIPDLSDAGKYMLVAGAVVGGGLTLIANAPNPAGAALLRQGFAGGSISAGWLLLGALPPTAVAALMFLI